MLLKAPTALGDVIKVLAVNNCGVAKDADAAPAEPQ